MEGELANNSVNACYNNKLYCKLVIAPNVKEACYNSSNKTSYIAYS